jgi:hypothetical protein
MKGDTTAPSALLALKGSWLIKETPQLRVAQLVNELPSRPIIPLKL